MHQLLSDMKLYVDFAMLPKFICLFKEAVCISDYETFYDRMIDAR